MSIKRKTVRFQDLPEDLAVYDAICNFKSYGFRTESHMVIEAVRLLMNPKTTEFSADELADKIVQRLSESFSPENFAISQPAESNEQTDEAIYDAALSFLDSF